MKFKILLLFLTLNIPEGKSQGKESNDFTVDSEIDSVSYSIGVNFARHILSQGLDSINTSLFMKGLQDILENRQPDMTEMDMRKSLSDYFNKIKAEKNNKLMHAGREFLAKNKKRPEVKELPNGLQYEVIVQGSGALPKPIDKVKTHYHGTTIDGQVFDSSVERGEPAIFPVNRVIAGWTQALQLMPVGSKWKLFIPFELAYGERGAGEKIGPYETLIFELELLEITQ